MKELNYVKLGNNDKTRMIWLHGWGQSHKTFLELVDFFKNEAENILIDLPGFGESMEPVKVWGSAEYVNFLADFIRELPSKKNIIIGHSFGGKLSAVFAAKYPELVDKIVLIGAAGFKKKRSLKWKLRSFLIKWISRLLGIIAPNLRNKFVNKVGSKDYKNASLKMKEVLKKVIKEDMSETSKKITQPALIIYGEKDTATPITFGVKYNHFIKDSKLLILPNFDHHSVIYSGKDQLKSYINKFIKEEK